MYRHYLKRLALLEKKDKSEIEDLTPIYAEIFGTDSKEYRQWQETLKHFGIKEQRE